MAKRHLKRYIAPKKWSIKRKGLVYVTRSNPGPHNSNTNLPLNIAMRDLMHVSNTAKETKDILNRKNVLVDGIRRKNPKFPVGLFDVIEFKEINKSYRVLLNGKDKFILAEISKDESNIKPCRIINKTAVKGNIQLNLNDGKNIIVEKDVFKTGDTVFLELPKFSIKKQISLKKDVIIYLTGGKHIGEKGRVKDIVENRIMYVRDNGDSVQTLKKYAFVIGEKEPIIKIIN